MVNKANSTNYDTERFGDWLVSRGEIDHKRLCQALTQQKKSGGRIGEVMVQMQLLNNEQLKNALAAYLNIESVSLDDPAKIEMNIARLVPEEIAKRFCLVAVGKKNGQIILAMGDPLNVVAIDTVSLRLRQKVAPVIATPGEINRAIEVIYHGSDLEEQRLRDLVEVEISTDEEEELEDYKSTDISREADAADAPVIKFVDLLLSQAVKSRASDIHIEPQEKSMNIRMRVDGVLNEMVPPPRKMQAAIIARLKILSEMDIAERRLPQDGRFKIKAPGRDIDVRVSSIPTIYGEKIVMRILDKEAVDHDINKIGFEQQMLETFKKTITQPHGIIIVTGPTGSGKSTTLYSALNYLKDPRKNITTVEDPVEYRLEGINQIQIKPEIDLDFALSLRSILRQDPDIILIGEIRDRETMEIAIKASLTGHLVLSTFHTNDAPSAISRLAYMGLEPYLLASTLNLIIAQRLVRKICPKCKEEVSLSSEVIKRLKLDKKDVSKTTFYQGKGCSNCNGTGYKSRLPIFEFLVVDTKIKEMLVKRQSESDIRQYARSKGAGGLLESGVKAILNGQTTAQEVLATTFAEDIE
jgi:type IV pilus assembly protein PilB